MPSLTQRQLPADLSGTRRFLPFGDEGEIDAYARVQRFQTLQEPLSQTDGASVIAVPFQRSPQIGVRGNFTLPDQLRFDMEAEATASTCPTSRSRTTPSTASTLDCAHPSGLGSPSRPRRCDTRVGGAARTSSPSVSRSFTSDWGHFEPQAGDQRHDLSLRPRRGRHARRCHALGAHAQRRQLVQLRAPDRAVRPRAGADAGAALPLRADPAPRPVRLPLYDTAPKDFNEVSIYSTNEFTGNDRISDENQLTAGVATRYNDAGNGRELLRLGIAQKFLFSEQWLTTVQLPGHHRPDAAALHAQAVRPAALRLVVGDGALELRRHRRAGSVRRTRAGRSAPS